MGTDRPYGDDGRPPALVGPPQRQKVYEQTPFRAVQTGHAEGYLFRPPLPPPKWPQWLKQGAPGWTEQSPRRVGLFGQQDYRVQWRWEFESPVMVDNEVIAERFLQLLIKELNIAAILPKPDVSSFRWKRNSVPVM